MQWVFNLQLLQLYKNKESQNKNQVRVFMGPPVALCFDDLIMYTCDCQQITCADMLWWSHHEYTCQQITGANKAILLNKDNYC